MSCPKGALIGPASSQKSSLETVYEHIVHPVIFLFIVIQLYIYNAHVHSSEMCELDFRIVQRIRSRTNLPQISHEIGYCIELVLTEE
jgi:hypothetical protein